MIGARRDRPLMRRLSGPRWAWGAVGAALALGLAASPALAATTAPQAGLARLQGQFSMAGRITVAVAVRGERQGQRVQRTWTFTPQCATGACATVRLVRTRARGKTDSLLLHRRSSGYYVGNGSFYAPLRCSGRTYRPGEKVPFTITVRITGTSVSGTTVIATRVAATYSNRSRLNLTPCVAFLGHDAASYQGQLVSSTPGGLPA